MQNSLPDKKPVGLKESLAKATAALKGRQIKEKFLKKERI
jgi:hypothetical protein